MPKQKQQTMGSCCLSGTLATGTPKGTVQTIAGLPTYVSEPTPKSNSKTIIFLPDAFGYTLPNIRLLADLYTHHGFTCLIPDVHYGDSLPVSLLQSVEPTLTTRASLSFLSKTLNTLRAGASLGPWLLRHRESVARPLIEKFISDVRREREGTEKVGVVGFCWGGRYAILAAQGPFSGSDGKNGGVDAAYAAHPSLCAIPGDFEGVRVPLSVALGEKDSYLGEREIEAVRKVMERKRREEGGVEGEVVVYEGQVHGFALRGDQENEGEKRALDDAARQGVEWFERWLV